MKKTGSTPPPSPTQPAEASLPGAIRFSVAAIAAFALGFWLLRMLKPKERFEDTFKDFRIEFPWLQGKK